MNKGDKVIYHWKDHAYPWNKKLGKGEKVTINHASPATFVGMKGSSAIIELVNSKNARILKVVPLESLKKPEIQE